MRKRPLRHQCERAVELGKDGRFVETMNAVEVVIAGREEMVQHKWFQPVQQVVWLINNQQMLKKVKNILNGGNTTSK